MIMLMTMNHSRNFIIKSFIINEAKTTTANNTKKKIEIGTCFDFRLLIDTKANRFSLKINYYL